MKERVKTHRKEWKRWIYKALEEHERERGGGERIGKK